MEYEGENIEQLVQNFCSAMEMENDGLWKAGEAVFDALRTNAMNAKNQEQAKERRDALFTAMSQAGKCTIARVRQLATVYNAFDEGSGRSQEHSWTFHRAVYNAARRTKESPMDLLQKAIDREWGQRELAAYGKADVPCCRLDAECGTCGFKVKLSKQTPEVLKEYGGLSLACPVCAARGNPGAKLGCFPKLVEAVLPELRQAAG